MTTFLRATCFAISAVTAVAGDTATAPRSIVLEHCLVTLVDEAEIPAQVDGALTFLDVREGDTITTTTLMARVDDRQAEIRRRVAEVMQQQAAEQAALTSEVEYARTAYTTAETDYQRALAAGEAISPSDLRRLNLALENARLGLDQAEQNAATARRNLEIRTAELDDAKTACDLRRIASPIDGQVTAVYRHLGEWVEAGDPVVHVMRMDRLRVEGFFSTAEHGVQPLTGRAVRIRVERGVLPAEEFTGQITFVNPQIEAGGKQHVWAEVTNRRAGDAWTLCPGMTAEMTIEPQSEVAQISPAATTRLSEQVEGPRDASVAR